jgi:hypothetical protein
MRQRRWMMLGLVLTSSVIAMAQTLDASTQASIDALIKTLKSDYVYAKNQDWAALRSGMIETARQSPAGQEVRNAVMDLLETINDPAMFYDEWFTQAQQAQRRDVGELGIAANAETRVIYEVFVGGGAAKAGLRVGDELVLINNKTPKIVAESVYSSGKVVPVVVKRGQEMLEFQVRVSAITEELGEKIAPMHAGRLGRVGYIESERGYMVSEASRIRVATGLQYHLRNLENSGACGYIVDLRRGVSDLWVNLSGFGPLLNVGSQALLKYDFLDRGIPEVSYDPITGSVKFDVSIRASISTRPWKPKQPNAPIAVLSSPMFAGPVRVSFVGRQNVRFFGETQGFPLHVYNSSTVQDGAAVVFPAGYIIDRLGHRYEAPLEVDEAITTDWRLFGTKNDTVIQAAQTWLESQPACK